MRKLAIPLVLLAGVGGASALLGHASCRRLRARRGPGLRDHRRAAARRRVAAAHQGGVQAGRRHPRAAPRASATYNAIAGFSFFTAHGGQLHGHRLHRLQAVGRARRPRADGARRSSQQLNGAVRAHPRGARLRLRAAGDPRHQRRRRLQHDAAGPQRRHVRVPGAERRARSWPRRASGPSSRACDPTSRRPCRSSSPTSTRTRR